MGLCRRTPCGCPPGAAMRLWANHKLPTEYHVVLVLSLEWWAKANSLQKLEAMSQFIKRAKEQRKKFAQPLPPDEKFQAEYPALWEFLTLAKGDDGKPRKTATLTIFVADGCFKTSLNDRQEACSCFGSGDSFDEALSVLEASIVDGLAEWREWKQDGSSGARRRN